MIVRAIKTRLVTPKSCTIFELLDESLSDLSEKSVVALAAKIVATCEGRVVSKDSITKDELVERESQLYIPSYLNRYNVTLAVARHRLIASAGVDESNSGDNYALWPADPQDSANQIRAYLRKRFKLKEVGVIITDSSTRPLQWGTTGIALSYSGFKPLRSYVGEKDLFGREFDYHTNSISNGLAAAAVLVGGEGAEQTPISVLTELDFVEFVDQDPSPEELAAHNIEPADDLYALMLEKMPWRKGRQPPQ